jgi:hypothetical protein
MTSLLIAFWGVALMALIIWLPVTGLILAMIAAVAVTGAVLICLHPIRKDT